ncbi:MAG: serine protease, partial [Anaerolineae bacterium]|nr:serine protease [Anaerolineae bacterium]
MRRVKSATIQIATDASLTDIDGTVYAQPGTGSGFIIDESGLAVTNNHVVTGGRSWKVYVGGDDRPLNARVVGVAECSDLAVIDIEGDGFPVLDWYEGDIYPGLSVYAAGYPLNDPEFTLTGGIISKQKAAGQTSWASVDGVIEHDATLNPGSAGGPLVTEDGQVVAVNYANFDLGQPGVSIQYRSIGHTEARAIVDHLREGEDMQSIGINGQAFLDEEEGISGIWVQSVQSGSAADEARIEGGDIIMTLEDRALAVDGTMAEYCDTLRSHDPDDALDIEVVRLATGEILEGQLNGRELKVVETDEDIAASSTATRPTAGAAKEEAAPTDEPTPTSPPPTATSAPQTGGGGGLGAFTLWGSNFWGTLGGGGEQWYTFNSNQETEATVIAFVQNADQIEIIVYLGNDIPVWPPKDANQVPNVGIATKQGNRDGNDKTAEFIWQGPIQRDTKYYVRFINRGGTTATYCV